MVKRVLAAGYLVVFAVAIVVGSVHAYRTSEPVRGMARDLWAGGLTVIALGLVIALLLAILSASYLLGGFEDDDHEW